MRKFVIAAAAVASMVALVGMAPSALASNESVEVSSVSSGVPISGSASSTLGRDEPIVLSISLPTSLFTSQQFAVYDADAASCETDYGITLAVEGISQTLSTCESTVLPPDGDMPESTVLFVSAEPARALADRVLTLTWNSNYTSSVASLAGATVWVYDLGSAAFVPVTLSGLPTSSSDEASVPILMWQQAYGRASASDSCQSGYTPSWDTWPNGGKGGFVCNRFVPEYGN